MNLPSTSLSVLNLSHLPSELPQEPHALPPRIGGRDELHDDGRAERRRRGEEEGGEEVIAAVVS